MAALLNHRAGWIYGAILVLVAGLYFYALDRWPPTLWVDEAWFGVVARKVVRGQDFVPLEVPGPLGVGNSPYQIYLSALVQVLGVPAAFSSRTASALSGWLAVALLYPVLSNLFRSWLPAPRAALAALSGTATLATLFVSLHYSRDGGQNAASTLAAVMCLGALFLTFERNRPRWAILSGLSLGMAQTTYEATLGFPLVAFAYVAVRYWRPGELSRLRILQLAGLMAAAAFIGFFPLMVLYWLRPELFFTHLLHTQNFARASEAVENITEVVRGLWRVALGISISGDSLPGRNLAGRPLFDPASSVVLWLGFGWTVLRARSQPAVQLLWLWVVIMALPSAVTSQAPAFPRMLAMTPALTAFVGLGVAWVWGWAASRPARIQVLTASLLSAGLVLGAFSSVHAYFVQWVNDPRVFDARSAGPRAVADQALAFTPDAQVFVTSRSDPFVSNVFDLMFAGTDIQTFDATNRCFPLAHRAPRPTAYGVIQVIDRSSLPMLQRAYPAGDQSAMVIHPDGYAYAVFFRVPAGVAAPSPQYIVNVAFQNELRLVGLDAPSEIKPGEAFALRLYWEVDSPHTLKPNLTGFVHVGLGSQSQPLIAQHDGPLCPDFAPNGWQPGYRYVEMRNLTVAAVAPSGIYDIRAGVYDPELNVRLGIVGGSQPVADNRALLFTLRVR